MPKPTATRNLAALLGKAAGRIDTVRSESRAKALRDDYTAFDLAGVSCALLFTSGAALSDHKMSELARQHLREFAAAVQDINSLIPAVMVHDLAHDGLDVDVSVVDSARGNRRGLEIAKKQIVVELTRFIHPVESPPVA